MATITRQVCDNHPERYIDVKPVAFGVNGRLYKLDLCPQCQGRFEDILNVWIERAVPVKVRLSKSESDEVRAWARENGWPTLRDQGVVPKDVMEAYEQAHSLPAASSNGHAPAKKKKDTTRSRGKTGRTRRSYSPQEKKAILKEAARVGPTEAARKFGVHATMITRWRREAA